MKEDETGRACGIRGGERNVYRVSVGKAARKRPPGRPWHR